jgi:hypothetical protein
VVWKLVPGFDVIVSDDDLHALPLPVQAQVIHYSFYHPELKRHVLCADDDRFTNHSDDANVRFHGEYAIAIRDIQEGEEITDNYEEFGKTIHHQTRPALSSL